MDVMNNLYPAIKRNYEQASVSFYYGKSQADNIETWRTESAPIGESDKFSTVARSSSTEAEIGGCPLFSGLISTWIFLSISSSLSLSELE